MIKKNRIIIILIMNLLLLLLQVNSDENNLEKLKKRLENKKKVNANLIKACCDSSYSHLFFGSYYGLIDQCEGDLTCIILSKVINDTISEIALIFRNNKNISMLRLNTEILKNKMRKYLLGRFSSEIKNDSMIIYRYSFPPIFIDTTTTNPFWVLDVAPEAIDNCKTDTFNYKINY
jgi:hypothetical protein